MSGVAGICMVKDEADVIYHTLMHMAEEGLKGIVIADNGSTDLTRAEIRRAQTDSPCKITMVEDRDPAYFQSRKMTRLAERAFREFGPAWIVPFDADELWYQRETRIANWLNDMDVHIGVVHADLYDHYPSGIDPEGINPFETIVWRRTDKAPLPKVAFRWHRIVIVEQGNHGVQNAQGGLGGGLEIRHFPYRTFEQFKRKALNGAAAYKATDLPETAGAHWRQYGAIYEAHGEDALREVFERWFWNLAPVNAGLILDPAPFRRWSRGEQADG